MDDPTTSWRGIALSAWKGWERYLSTHPTPHFAMATAILTLWISGLVLGADIQNIMHVLAPLVALWEYKIAYQIYTGS